MTFYQRGILHRIRGKNRYGSTAVYLATSSRWSSGGLFKPLASAAYALAVDVDYPRSEPIKMFLKERSQNLYVPEKTILRLDELTETYVGKRGEKVFADWGVLFAYELLHGFGDNLSYGMEGDDLCGLRQLASIWGSYLATMLRSLFQYKMSLEKALISNTG